MATLGGRDGLSMGGEQPVSNIFKILLASQGSRCKFNLRKRDLRPRGKRTPYITSASKGEMQTSGWKNHWPNSRSLVAENERKTVEMGTVQARRLWTIERMVVSVSLAGHTTCHFRTVCTG